MSRSVFRLAASVFSGTVPYGNLAEGDAMPADAPRRKQTPILWIAILVAVPLLFLCCGGVGVVALVVANRARETAVGDSILPSFTVERLDPDNL